MKQEMMGLQWHQLYHMQIICTFLQTDNLASTSLLIFKGHVLFLMPNEQCQSKLVIMQKCLFAVPEMTNSFRVSDSSHSNLTLYEW